MKVCRGRLVAVDGLAAADHRAEFGGKSDGQSASIRLHSGCPTHDELTCEVRTDLL